MSLRDFVLSVKTTDSGIDYDPKLEVKGPTLAAHIVSLLGFCSQYRDPGSMMAQMHSSPRVVALGQGMFGKLPVDSTVFWQH